MAGADSDIWHADLASLSRLRELSIRLAVAPNLPAIFEEVLDATMRLTHADFGEFQLFNEQSGTLSIVAHRGLDQQYLDYFSSADALTHWVSGRAMQSRSRVVVKDIRVDANWATQRAIADHSGFCSIEAIPLFERSSGTPLGVVSALFRNVHRASEHQRHLTDLYGERAATVIAFKLSEQRLQVSSERLQAAVDLLALGLYAWDPQSNAIEWDARVKAMWGLPPDAPVDYDKWHQRIHPDDVARVDIAVAACTDPAGDGIYEVEYRVNGADGVERWIATRGRSSFSDGRAVSLVGVARDITAQKAAEARLHESKTRLSAILRQLPVGVGLVDKQGHFLLRGGLLGSMWSTTMPSSDPSQGGRWRSYSGNGNALKPEDYPEVRALRGETLAQGVDFIHTADDGRETWIRIDAAPFRNARGEIDGAVVILQDIDTEKRAEQAMRESEIRFRQFAEHSTDVLWILNVATRHFDDVSPAYEIVFGRPRPAMVGYWTEAIHPEDRDHALAELDRAAQGELVVQEYRILHLDGTLRRLRETMFPIRDQSGQIKRIGGISQDITSRVTSQLYLIGGSARSGRVSAFLQRAGYSVRSFDSGAEFLEMAPVLAPGCVVFDVIESNDEVIQTLRRFKANRSDLPVVVLGNSRGDVIQAVAAMKAGAVDWLELPDEGDEMLAAIASALAEVGRATEVKVDTDIARASIAGMSERGRQVLEFLLAGGTNKQIARQLGLSPRTVELHRASVMKQLGVKTLSEAVLMATAAGVRPASSWRHLKRSR